MSSVPQSSLATQAFLLTVSTKGDISDECVKSLVKHIKSTTVHAFVVTEHGESGKLHLHAVLVYKDPRESKKIRDNVWERQVKPFHPDSIGRVAVKIQVCPGHKWYDEYLQKETDHTVLLDTYERELVTEYFPTVAVQEALMATHKHKGIACAWLEQDVKTWTEGTFPNSPEGALTYLNSRMYVLKNMVPIADPRKLTEKAVMYWKYRNNHLSPTTRELMYLHQLQSLDRYVPPEKPQLTVRERQAAAHARAKVQPVPPSI